MACLAHVYAGGDSSPAMGGGRASQAVLPSVCMGVACHHRMLLQLPAFLSANRSQEAHAERLWSNDRLCGGRDLTKAGPTCKHSISHSNALCGDSRRRRAALSRQHAPRAAAVWRQRGSYRLQQSSGHHVDMLVMISMLYNLVPLCC